MKAELSDLLFSLIFREKKRYIIAVGQHVPRREGESETDYGEDDRYRPSGL